MRSISVEVPAMVRSLINIGGINMANPTPLVYQFLLGLHLDNIPWLFSMIANIVNRAPVSTYHYKRYDLLRRSIYVAESENYVVFHNLWQMHDENAFIAYSS